MKRTIGTLGAVGVAALVVAAPATADRGWSEEDKIIICHAGTGSNSKHYTTNSVALPSMNGHADHDRDIIPPSALQGGRNWTEAGQAIYANGCATAPVGKPPVEEPPGEEPPAEKPPVEEPPAEEPPAEEPPVDNPTGNNPPLDNPPGDTPPAPPAPPAEAPAAVTPATPVVAAQPSATQVQQTTVAGAGAAVSRGTNQGYNAQTAVGSNASSPAWLGGAGALVAAGAAVAIRRRSASSPQAR